MDDQYDCMFDLRDLDCDEEHYHHIIPTVDISVFRRVLDKDLKIINNSKLTMQQWVRFKYNLLKAEEEWGVFVWIWGSAANPSFVNICIDWDKLENKPTRYFQVHMALENVWMGDDRLANIWKYIVTLARNLQNEALVPI
jgi:hypothetical protein